MTLSVNVTAVGGVERYRYTTTSRLGTSTTNSADPQATMFPALNAGDTVTVTVNLDDWDLPATPDTAGCGSLTLTVTDPTTTGSL